MTLSDAILIEKFRSSLDYVFGGRVSSSVSSDELSIELSKKTGMIRRIYLSGALFATLKPDGSIALTISGAQTLVRHPSFSQNCVGVIRDQEIEEFVKRGRSLFSAHVSYCGDSVRLNSEVAVLDYQGQVIAVGKAMLPSGIMKQMTRGMAVKVRAGSLSRVRGNLMS